MMRGPVRSMKATRLLVVPRSMPTMRGSWIALKSICSRSDILFQFPDQGRYVAAAVQQAADFDEEIAVAGLVVGREYAIQIRVDLRAPREKPAERLLDPRPHGCVAGTQFLERHIQLEDLFEKFGRHALRLALGGSEALILQHVLGARHRVAQRAVGVVENGGRVEGEALLFGRAALEAIGMDQAAEAVIAPLQIVLV